jgi:hypothetical protein
MVENKNFHKQDVENGMNKIIALFDEFTASSSAHVSKILG